MRPEYALLGRCVALARGLPPRIPAPDPSALDAGGLLDLAGRHKALGDVLAGARLEPGLVPDAALGRLERAHRAGRAARSTMLAEAIRVSAAFRDAGIRLVLVKGPALSTLLYGDPLAREYRDLDFIARERDGAKVLELATSLGYRPEHMPASLGAGTARFAWERSRHLAFRHPELPVFLEIHSARGPRLDYPFERGEAARAPLAELALAGGALSAFDAPTQAAHALGHGTRHDWMTLQSVGDALSILHGPDRALAEATRARLRADGARAMLEAAELVCERFSAGHEPGAKRVAPGFAARRSAALALAANRALGGRKPSSLDTLRRAWFGRAPLERSVRGYFRTVAGVFAVEPQIGLWTPPRPLRSAYLALAPFFTVYRKLSRLLGRDPEGRRSHAA